MGVDLLHFRANLPEKLPAETYRAYYDVLIDYDINHNIFLGYCGKSYTFYGRIPAPTELLTTIDTLEEAKKTDERSNLKSYRDLIYDKVFRRLEKKKDKIIAVEGQQFLASGWLTQYNTLLTYTGAYTVETWTTGSGITKKMHAKTELPEPAIVMSAWKAITKK